jgi:hypothetical protein
MVQIIYLRADAPARIVKEVLAGIILYDLWDTQMPMLPYQTNIEVSELHVDEVIEALEDSGIRWIYDE